MKPIMAVFSLLTISLMIASSSEAGEQNTGRRALVQSQTIVCSVEFKDYDNIDGQLSIGTRKETLQVAAKFSDLSSDQYGQYVSFVAGDTFKVNLNGDIPGGVGLRAENPMYNPDTHKYESNRIGITIADADNFSMKSEESRACKRDSKCLEMGPLKNDYIGVIGNDGKSITLSNDKEGHIDASYLKLLKCELRKTPIYLLFSDGKILNSEITD